MSNNDEQTARGGPSTPQRGHKRVDSSSSSLGQSASSSSTTGSSPSGGSRCRKKPLPWWGKLSQDALDLLRIHFDDLILCPGILQTSIRLIYEDASGYIMVPDGRKGYEAVSSILQEWSRLVGEDRYSWWEPALEQEGIRPLRGFDLLRGLTRQAWVDYRAIYKRLRQEQNLIESAQATAPAQNAGDPLAPSSSTAAHDP